MLVQVLHGGKYFNLLCTEAPNESQLSPLSRALTRHRASLSEVSVHVGHHLWRTGRWRWGIGELGWAGELQFLEPLYVFVTQGQELHVPLLHWIGLLEGSTNGRYGFPRKPLYWPLMHGRQKDWKVQRVKHPALRHQEISSCTHCLTFASHMPLHLFKVNQLRHGSGLLCPPAPGPLSSFIPRGNNSSQAGMWPPFLCRFMITFPIRIWKQNTLLLSVLWKLTLMVVVCIYRLAFWPLFLNSIPVESQWMTKAQLISPLPHWRIPEHVQCFLPLRAMLHCPGTHLLVHICPWFWKAVSWGWGWGWGLPGRTVWSL